MKTDGAPIAWRYFSSWRMMPLKISAKSRPPNGTSSETYFAISSWNSGCVVSPCLRAAHREQPSDTPKITSGRLSFFARASASVKATGSALIGLGFVFFAVWAQTSAGHAATPPTVIASEKRMRQTRPVHMGWFLRQIERLEGVQLVLRYCGQEIM